MAVDKQAQAQTLKVLIDAYGVAVRAGLLTPCLQDENAFRKMLGLEEAPPEVVRSWASTSGVRMPVTIQDGITVAEGSDQQEESYGVE